MSEWNEETVSAAIVAAFLFAVAVAVGFYGFRAHVIGAQAMGILGVTFFATLVVIAYVGKES